MGNDLARLSERVVLAGSRFRGRVKAAADTNNMAFGPQSAEVLGVKPPGRQVPHADKPQFVDQVKNMLLD